MDELNEGEAVTFLQGLMDQAQYVIEPEGIEVVVVYRPEGNEILLIQQIDKGSALGSIVCRMPTDGAHTLIDLLTTAVRRPNDN